MKKPPNENSEAFDIVLATSYSPTQLPMQYIRR